MLVVHLYNENLMKLIVFIMTIDYALNVFINNVKNDKICSLNLMHYYM